MSDDATPPASQERRVAGPDVTSKLSELTSPLNQPIARTHPCRPLGEQA